MHVITGSAPARTQTFSVWVPATPQLHKSRDDDDAPRYVQGLSSDSSRDEQGERVLSDGVDFSPLLGYGHLNWDHLPGPANLIGVPLEADLRETKKGFGVWLRGMLYKGKRVADDAWEHLLTVANLAAQGLPHRPVGWSVEGGIVARDPGDRSVIQKSVVRHMALTHQPVNTNTYAEIAKSLGQAWQREPGFEYDANVHYSFDSFAEFAKSFGEHPDTQAMAPLGLQNLGGEVTSVLLDALGHACDGRCRKEARGRRKAYRHLTTCKGMGDNDAFTLVKSLVDYLD